MKNFFLVFLILLCVSDVSAQCYVLKDSACAKNKHYIEEVFLAVINEDLDKYYSLMLSGNCWIMLGGDKQVELLAVEGNFALVRNSFRLDGKIYSSEMWVVVGNLDCQ